MMPALDGGLGWTRASLDGMRSALGAWVAYGLLGIGFIVAVAIL